MFCLFLDFSWRMGLFALFRDGHLLEESCLPLEDSCHHCLEWQKLLDRHHLLLSDISYYAFGSGPGSFTGIRSAAATAKTVAFATAKPVLPLSSLLAFVPDDYGSYRVVVDRGVGGVYTQRICHTQEAVQTDVPLACAWEDIQLCEDEQIVAPIGTNLSPFISINSMIHRSAPHALFFARASHAVFSSGGERTCHDAQLWYGGHPQ